MNRSPVKSFLVCLTPLFLISGCATQNYRWQTEISPQGSITRTISQPRNATADEIEDPHLWNKLRHHAPASRTVWPERITSARMLHAEQSIEDSSEEYFIAEGKFANVDEIPPHYRLELNETQLVSDVTHSLRINDYHLVKEFIWIERVTDVVKVEDIPVARRETIDLVATVLELGLKKDLGPDYDASRLIHWIRTDGEKMLEQFTLLVHNPELRNLTKVELEERLQTLLASYGIAALTQKEFDKFIQTRLREGIARKDGKPISDAEFESVFQNLKKLVENREQNESDSPFKKAMDAAMEDYLAEKGTEAEQIAWFFSLLPRQFGLHGTPFMHPPQEFDVWMKLPGEIVETNGTIEPDGFLKWTFENDDIFPTGYTMTARSYFPVRVRNSQVLRKQKLGLRNEMVQFVELLKADENLRETFDRCVKQNSLTPLEDLVNKRHREAGIPGIGTTITTEEQARWHRARRLYDLLNQDGAATVNE